MKWLFSFCDSFSLQIKYFYSFMQETKYFSVLSRFCVIINLLRLNVGWASPFLHAIILVRTFCKGWNLAPGQAVVIIKEESSWKEKQGEDVQLKPATKLEVFHKGEDGWKLLSLQRSDPGLSTVAVWFDFLVLCC